MPQPQKTYRVKALKMFKAPTGGALPEMVNPGDVVEVDTFMAGMLVHTAKAELTDEKVRINRDYQSPARPAAAQDPITLLAAAVSQLTKIVQDIAGRKGQAH
jgi:hypothetical protein